ncbi:hypothetical protein Nm8I071_31320 [Nonomuraea sp. TT08I-71]|nr:hypothetical protein Nm8I071_31320 [Nonomuraea sp. TT08I-71]
MSTAPRRSAPARPARAGPAGPRLLAGPGQQPVDPVPLRVDVDGEQFLRGAVGEPSGLGEGGGQLVPQRAGRGQRQRLGQIPEQLVQGSHDGEGVEHPPGGRRVGPPVAPAEGALRDVLAGAEAVEDGAAGEAALPQVPVDAAAGVGAQVRAGLTGGLVEREVGGGGERRRDAADPEAARAVGAQLPVAAARGLSPAVLGRGPASLVLRLGHASRPPARHRRPRPSRPPPFSARAGRNGRRGAGV